MAANAFLPDSVIRCLLPPGFEQKLAESLAEEYLIEMRRRDVPLPSDYSDTSEVSEGWTDEDERQITAEFVAFLNHWRERTLSTLEKQNRSGPPDHVDEWDGSRSTGAATAPGSPAIDPYLDSKRFPLTTQPGLNLHDQKMIDAFNLDELNEMIEQNRPLDEEQKQILEELREKHSLQGQA